LLADFTVGGDDQIPEVAPYILAINHISLLDALVAFAVVPHQFAGVVAEGWAESPVVGRFMSWITTIFPVKAGATDPRAVSRATRWLRDGGVLLLAPEGRVSETRALLPGNPGLAYIASRSGAPVVPLAAWGQETAIGRLMRLRRPRIDARVGAAIAVPRLPRDERDAQLAAHTEEIMHALADLLPDEYKGVYRGPPDGPIH
jgi:1-acyl-sn-glycerol-3-phosphate acyltransferase